MLLAADGLSNTAVAAKLGTGKHTLGKWRGCFSTLRVHGLLAERWSGAPRRTGDDQAVELIDRTLGKRPAGASRWILRSMAQTSCPSSSTIGRVWCAFGLQPSAPSCPLHPDHGFSERSLKRWFRLLADRAIRQGAYRYVNCL